MTPKHPIPVKDAPDKERARTPHDPIFEQTMCAMFPPEYLRETAKETGVVERERKIDAVAIFWVLVLSFGVELQRSLASLKRSYMKRTGTKISDSSWYERFSPELVLFLKQAVIHGIEYMAKGTHRRLSEKLDWVKDVLIQDSTVIRLHAKLAKIWPATRSRKVAAGVKLGVLVSAVANSVKSVSLFGERTSEIKTLRIGPWVKDRVLLIDLGFYKHQFFARIEENGGFFVSRLKGTADPLIISVNSICRGNSIDLVGKHWSEVVNKLHRQVLDVVVEISVQRRRYKGNHSKGVARFRMVAIYNDDEQKYHAYITNIGTDKLYPEEIASLYGARWVIELLFKELKSKYALDVIKTTNPHIVAALIWVAILTLLVSRLINSLVRRMAEAHGKSIVRFTDQRWSTVFCETARDHLKALLSYLNIDMSAVDFYLIYESQVFDPHVNREKFTGAWWS
jgi:putative transposase